MKLSRRRLFGLIGASAISPIVEPVARALAAERVVAPMMPAVQIASDEILVGNMVLSQVASASAFEAALRKKLVVQLYKQSPLVAAYLKGDW